MEPVIQYAMTSDGVNIAFSVFGEGPPLLFLPVLPLSHLQVEWQMPGMREFLEAFAEQHTVVRFDARGLGLSDRQDSERTLDAHLRDLEAVVERLGFERLSLFAASYSGPVAIRFAARHPELVERMILWSTHAYHAEVVQRLPAQADQQRMAVNQLADVDRDLFIRTYLHRAVGWSEGEIANRFVEVAKQSIDPARFFENLANHASFDAREDLPLVHCPTLVLHRPAFIGSSVDVAKGLAARMRNARLALLEGESVVPFIGDRQAVLDVALGFLREGAPPSRLLPDVSAVRTLLYTDIEGHSTIIQRLGDARGRDLLREHERITREALREFGGEEIRALGDGFLASFRSTQEALRCAISLQRAFEAADAVHGERVSVRVGMNAGEPIAEDDALHGSSVVLAERIAGMALGGQILASLVVRELVAGKGFHFEPRELPMGDADAEQITLFEVRWRDEQP